MTKMSGSLYPGSSSLIGGSLLGAAPLAIRSREVIGMGCC